MKKFSVGLQLYSIREEITKDVVAALTAVAEMGYEYVEFAGGNYGGLNANEIKALLEKLGLKCISVHENYSTFAEKGQEAIDFLKTFGVKYWVIPWYNVAELAGTEKWEETKEKFSTLGKALHENGMQLLYHNHDFEFKKHEGKYLIDHLYDDVPEILPQFDSCWVKYAGEEPCKYIEKFAGKIKVLHLKDFTCDSLAAGPVYELVGGAGLPSKEENNFRFRPCGQGMQDFPAILASAEKAGIDYVIVEQDQWYDTPALQCAKESREYLKTLGL